MRFLTLRRQVFSLGLALCFTGACADEKPDTEVTRLVTTPDAGPAIEIGTLPSPAAPTPAETVFTPPHAVVVPDGGAPLPAKVVAAAPATQPSAPVAKTPDRDAELRTHLDRAKEAIAENDTVTALDEARLAVAIDPKSSLAWNTLGRATMQHGDLDEAAAAFITATDIKADNIFAWNNLGLVEMRRGHWDVAVDALEKATRQPAPNIPQAYMFNNLGAAYEHQGRMVEARTAYHKAADRGSAMAKDHLAKIDGHSAAKADLDIKSWEDVGPSPIER